MRHVRRADDVLTNVERISASGDRSLRVWCIRTGAILAHIEPHSRGIASVSFEPTLPTSSCWRPKRAGGVHKGTVVTGSSDSSVKIFHLVSYASPVSRTGSKSCSDAEDDRRVSFEDMILEDTGTPSSTSLQKPLEVDACLTLEKRATCWAPCSCPPSLSRPDGRRCGRCLNRGHMELVRSVWLTDDVLLSGGYDGSVRVSMTLTCHDRGRLVLSLRLGLGQGHWSCARRPVWRAYWSRVLSSR